MTGTARYLFAIARGPLNGHELAAVTGHRGAALDLVSHRGLQAVVCDVDLDEFGEEALRTNLERLDWLEEVARTHDDVVRAAAEAATTAPMRLVTICTDDDSVRQRVDLLHDDLARALDRVEGRSEWSVKVYATAAAEPVAERPGGESGVAYLQRKRELASRRQSTQEQLAAMAEEIRAALATQAVASRVLAAQDPQLTGRSEPMVLNAAFLVADDETSGFQRTAEAVRAQHPDVALVVQGPWPPYSFAVLA